MNWPKATLANAITVALGSIVGLLFQDVFTDDMKEIMFQAIGLGTILIGVKMALKLPDGYMLVFIFSLILGGILGELIHLDTLLSQLSDLLKSSIGSEESTFTEGLITAFLLFCIGSMTIVGALEEGLTGSKELLYVKAMLDGFSSIALAATFGLGVIFSIIPMVLFQGGITLGAVRLQKLMTENVIDTLSAVGGVLILGISINMLKLGDINLENLLPALLFAVLLSKILDYRVVKKAA